MKKVRHWFCSFRIVIGGGKDWPPRTADGLSLSLAFSSGLAEIVQCVDIQFERKFKRFSPHG